MCIANRHLLNRGRSSNDCATKTTTTARLVHAGFLVVAFVAAIVVVVIAVVVVDVGVDVDADADADADTDVVAFVAISESKLNGIDSALDSSSRCRCLLRFLRKRKSLVLGFLPLC